jgi:ribosomal protein S18 acetylase RimI-like enzyme
LAILDGAFTYGRFHRDFSLDKKAADQRYARWLKELYLSGNIFALLFENQLAGFFAFSGNRIALHALGKDFRGKGLSKYLWSAACKELFRRGNQELISFISATNIPVLNLYISLGFRFRNPKDVYHRLVLAGNREKGRS